MLEMCSRVLGAWSGAEFWVWRQCSCRFNTLNGPAKRTTIEQPKQRRPTPTHKHKHQHQHNHNHKPTTVNKAPAHGMNATRLTLNSDNDTETEKKKKKSKLATVAGTGNLYKMQSEAASGAGSGWVALGSGYVCVRVAGAYKRFKYVRWHFRCSSQCRAVSRVSWKLSIGPVEYVAQGLCCDHTHTHIQNLAWIQTQRLASITFSRPSLSWLCYV